MTSVGAVIFAYDVARLSHFYAAVATLPVRSADGNWACLGDEHFELIVHGVPPDIAQQYPLQQPVVPREDAAIKLLLPVPDIAAARRVAAELGGCVFAPDREWTMGGLTLVDGYDPEGNVFQLRQRQSPA